MIEPAFSISELMAVVMARTLRNGELAVMGASSGVPMAACRLAQCTHAPDLTFLAGAAGSVNPRLPFVPISTADDSLLWADTSLPLTDVVMMEGRGDLIDVFFAGGMQIDAFGNCNLIVIGDWSHPRMRGPGTAGLPFISRVGRVVLYTNVHDPRIFVERVDFISGPGFLGGAADWKSKRVPTGGPSLVVTPLGTMDFAPDTRRMRLASVHPGVKVEQLLAATGFALTVPDSVAVTPPPTQEELAILRRLKILDDPGQAKTSSGGK